MGIQKKYENVLDKMKLVAESSLHNKPQEEKLRIMMQLRQKKDLEEKIRLEQKKKEDEERLENYYISLKNMKKDVNNTQLRRSFFTTDLVDYES